MKNQPLARIWTMSNNLILIKYQLGTAGRYLESSGEVIASSFDDDGLLEELREIAPLATLTIYEDEVSDEASEAECLLNEKIPEIMELIKARFIQLLKCTEVATLENSADELVRSISAFRTITNIYQLLEIKYLKYRVDDTVIVKLG
jgi:hypothetical protein